MPTEYVAIPITPLPVVPEEAEESEEQQEFESEREGVCVCRNCAGWAVAGNLVLMVGMVGAVIYGFVWIADHYSS
jgi:hypothetical protein